MHINYENIDNFKSSKEILKNEIKNIRVFYHKILKGDILKPEKENDTAKIFILAEGEININNNIMKNRGISAFIPENDIEIMGISDSAILEINVKTDCNKADKSLLPFYLNYEDADTYKEDCKSEKTKSRFLLKQRIIPDIAIGSVETYGSDEVGCHTHPYVEQLFFGFKENNMELVIDGELFHMDGNTLVHIPLASNHGVMIKENQCAHYIWIDYMIDEKALEYLDTAHKL